MSRALLRTRFSQVHTTVDHPEARMDTSPDPDWRVALQRGAHSEHVPNPGANDHYRLAGAEIGTGRSSGSELLAEALALLWPEPLDWREGESLEEWTRRYRERTERALALEAAAAEAADTIHRADVARRRIARKQGSLQKRAEREARRAEGGMYVGEKRRPNHPMHVEVDPAAWNTVKRDAVRRRTTIARAVGDLVGRAAEERLRPRRDPRRAPAHRFARLFVDDETWASFRTLAFDLGVSAGRLVGLIVEREARRIEPEAE